MVKNEIDGSKEVCAQTATSGFLEKSVCANTYKNISFIIDIY